MLNPDERRTIKIIGYENKHAVKHRWYLMALVALMVFNLGYNQFVQKPKYEDLIAEAYDMGYEQGKKAGRTLTDYKKVALTDHKFSRNLCTAWWFGANAKERKLR